MDVSDTAVARVRDLAGKEGASIEAVRAELPTDPLPTGPYAIVLVHHYLDRRLWATLPDLLATGGVLLCCQPTVHNLERHARPSERFLLGAGEIHTLADHLTDSDPDLEVVEATEGWTAEGRHEGHLVVRRRDR